MDEQKRREAAASLMKDMEATAARMRALIVAMPPHDLLGFIYAQHLMKALVDQSITDEKGEGHKPNDLVNESQFLLEYVHAVLAADFPPAQVSFDEAKCVELFELSRTLKQQALIFAMASSASTKDGVFGPDTADIEFRAKSTWIMIRGNRHQVLEGEFYSYVLEPHDDVLRQVYGVTAIDVAEGFQAMANATRSGQADAILEMMKQFDDAQAFAVARDKPLEDVVETWVASNVEQSKAAGRAMDNLFRGGIANVSRHTKLPATLLADLAYQRGEEAEFFAAGDFSGTPYRTLPVRKKPLVQLGSDFYAVDPCFTRDAGYRALLYNLLKRKPDYKQTFEARQKTMSEAAFADILSAQLPGGTIFQEVYYKDPTSKQWVENDTLILIDDVLFLIEAKAGAAATIASPALDFGRHALSVQDLVLKAYKQCERFFHYLGSAEEVPIYRIVDGKHEECGRVRRSNYRLMIPIGLTVESFSPFSAYCKELPQVMPLLGKHPFVSLSIDDLFVLKRFLPTPGSFAHYMEVRQAVAGKRKAHLFDEMDHLGAYLTKNRFDQTIAEQMKDGKASMILWDGMSEIVDKSFEGGDWEARPLPTQDFPAEVLDLIVALDATRDAGWLSAESHIRSLGKEGRDNLGKILSELLPTLRKHPARYFTLTGDGQPLFVWLQNIDHEIDWKKVNEKATAATLSANATAAVSILAKVSADGSYRQAQSFSVQLPKSRTVENAHIFEDAERMAQPERKIDLNQLMRPAIATTSRKVGRNQRCPCGSGLKFKRCHGQ